MSKIAISLFVFFSIVQLQAQCSWNTHTNFLTDSWKSCTVSANPNPDRQPGAWLLYNFGHLYKLRDTYIWNFNEEGQTGNGLKNVAIDYSLDGLNWGTLGQFEFPQASGFNNYTGFDGPDFGGVEAQYILISAISNWEDTNCFGLSEIKFYVDAITSTEELSEMADFKIYPNPGVDVVRINGSREILSIEIFNAHGQMVQISHRSDFIDISSLTSGIYHFRITTKEGMKASRKFIKLGE